MLAWATGPREVRVEFDRPVPPGLLKDVLKRSKLTAGEHARAGDRFESIWPGYAVVQMQRIAPRHDVPIRSAQLTPDGRTLVLATDPLRSAVHYALTLPGMGRPAARPAGSRYAAAARSDRPRFRPDRLRSDLDAGRRRPGWTGWLPHLDLQVAREITAGSAPHDALWAAMDEPGELMVKTQLDLTDMLRPAVQPGSTIDYRACRRRRSRSASRSDSKPDIWLLPSRTATSKRHLRSRAGARTSRCQSSCGSRRRAGAATLTVELDDQRGQPAAAASFAAALLPWADTSGKASRADGARSSAGTGRRQLGPRPQGVLRRAGPVQQMPRDPRPGRHHRPRPVEPDPPRLRLGAARHHQPSFAINPDHLSYAVRLDDGRTLTGVVQTSPAKCGSATSRGIRRKSSRPSRGDAGLARLDDARGAAEAARPGAAARPDDVPAHAPPQMPRDYVGPRPKPRTIAEVNAVLAGAPNPPAETRPIRVVLVAGPKDHGPGEHDYPAWQKAWAELLAAADKVEVVTAWEWPAKEEFEKADVMVFYQHGDWDAQRAADSTPSWLAAAELVYIHWAVDGRKLGGEIAKRIGLAALGGVGFRHGDLTLDFNREANHPVTRNFESLEHDRRDLLEDDRHAARRSAAGAAPSKRASRSRSSGRSSTAKAACSCRSPATTRGRSTTRCSACCSCGPSPGRPTSRSIGSTTWSGRVRSWRNNATGGEVRYRDFRIAAMS